MTATDDKRTDAMIMEYTEARDDERYFVALQGTVVALALTGVSVLGALASEVAKGTQVPDPLLAGAPLIILCILAFGQSIGGHAVLRSFYMRSLEREIRSRLELNSDFPSYPGLGPLTYTELSVSYSGIARGTGFGRFMAVFIFGSLWLVFGGLTLFLALDVTPPWRIAMAMVHGGGALAIFTSTVRVNVSGRRFFRAYADLARRRRDEPLTPRAGQQDRTRSALVRYLLLPRPDDLVKGLFVAAGYATALVARPSGGQATHNMAAAILFLIAVEWLIYQSRYQWNDIRGVHEDQRAPSRESRARLPGGVSSIPASIAVMGLRLALTLWVAALDWPGEPRISHSDLVMFLAIPLIFGIALFYETVRGAARRRSNSSLPNFLTTVVGVGLGYPVRFAVGWWAAGGTWWSPAFGAVLVALWGLGVFFVSLTWMLEFADHIHSTDAAAPPSYMVSSSIVLKPHLLVLGKVSGVRCTVSDALGPEPVDGGGIPFLRKQHFRWTSPWIAGVIVWYCGISVGLAGLLHAGHAALWPWGIAAAVAVASTAIPRAKLLGHVAGAALFSAGAVIHLRAEISAGDVPTVASFAVASLLAALLFSYFYYTSYRATRGGFQKVATGLRVLASRAGKWFVGRA